MPLTGCKSACHVHVREEVLYLPEENPWDVHVHVTFVTEITEIPGFLRFVL